MGAKDEPQMEGQPPGGAERFKEQMEKATRDLEDRNAKDRAPERGDVTKASNTDQGEG